MRTFQKIMCPVDFSETSVRALQWTEYLAKKYQSEVAVLHVQESPYIVHLPLMLNPEERSRENQPALAAEIDEFLRPLNVKHQSILSTGQASDKIVALAKGLDATLIVMGTRGLLGAAHKLLGSTTENVVRNSVVPVMTIPPNSPAPQGTETHKVLMPVSSLQWPVRGSIRLRKMIRELNCSLTLIHIVGLNNEMFDARFDANPFLVTTYEVTQKKQELLKVGARIAKHRETTEAIIEFGDVAQELLKEISGNKYDYVLMGAHKRTLLSRFVESTVYKVISRTKIPVITVRVS